MYSSRNTTRNTYAACCHSLSSCTSKSPISSCKAYFPTSKTPYYHAHRCLSWGKRESKIPLMANLAAKFTRVRDNAHCNCVTKITHSWNAVHSFRFFCMIIEIKHLLSCKAILLSSVIVAKERVPNPLIRREAGIPRWKLKMATCLTIKVIDSRFKTKRSLSTI